MFLSVYTRREKIFTRSNKPNISLIRLQTSFVLIICDIPISHKNIFHNGKRKKSKIVFTKLLIRKHSVYSVSPSANCPRKPGKLFSSVWRATIILKSQIFCISLSTPSNQWKKVHTDGYGKYSERNTHYLSSNCSVGKTVNFTVLSDFSWP